MKQKIMVVASVAIFIGLISAVFIALGTSSAEAKKADPNIVVTLKGLGIPVDTPDDVSGDCFKTELLDTHTGRVIGDGLDCLVIADSDLDGNLLVDRTTVFNFHKGKMKGRLVARGMTTVVPIFGASSPDYSHVVGDVDSSTSNIVSGTKKFKHSTGNVRLSGIVNLGDFPNTILFNCIFVIDLD